MSDDRIRDGFVRLTKLHELDPKTQTDQQWIDAAAVREIAPRTCRWDEDSPQAGWIGSWTDVGLGLNHWVRVAEPAEVVIDLVAEARRRLALGL